MLNYLKQEGNKAYTENGALSYATTNSDCLDLFSTIGALREADQDEIVKRFVRAYAENSDIAVKTAFYARDVRGGLGERKVFRTILHYMAQNEPKSVLKNIENIPEYGRFDDLFVLMDTPCKDAMVEFVKRQLEQDLKALESEGKGLSLLAKWMPSVNASNEMTVKTAKDLARCLKMREKDYRKTLAKLRKAVAILENNLRLRDYTFDYEKQPSKAMFQYRKAFQRNDGQRYGAFMENVKRGKTTLHTAALYPYEVIAPCLRRNLFDAERKSLDVTWGALPDYTNNENALVVVDGSGSMYRNSHPNPIEVALSLGIYFAQHNKGVFANHFITFSDKPRLVEIKGNDIYEKVRYCASYNEVASTNIEGVFDLILKTALGNHLPQEELPKKLYIISDMEFNQCATNADSTNFESAKKRYHQYGYELPQLLFWNVSSRNEQQPVTRNEQGVALVSGSSPRVFDMVVSGVLSPYQHMMEVLSKERYASITA